MAEAAVEEEGEGGAEAEAGAEFFLSSAKGNDFVHLHTSSSIQFSYIIMHL